MEIDYGLERQTGPECSQTNNNIWYKPDLGAFTDKLEEGRELTAGHRGGRSYSGELTERVHRRRTSTGDTQ